MRVFSLFFIILAATGFSSCTEANRVERRGLLTAGPVRTVTAEPGVIPRGTSLVVLTNDVVSTRKAFRSTVYAASIAKDVLDQDGTVLIPRESPVELVVRSLWYLGPGGVGMTELRLGVEAVTVDGVRYPVESGTEKPNAGGIGLEGHSAKVIGETAGEVLTSGSRINVPAETLLAFQIEDPIRLRSYRPHING
jgi:hypothetical protein